MFFPCLMGTIQFLISSLRAMIDQRSNPTKFAGLTSYGLLRGEPARNDGKTHYSLMPTNLVP
jgi:hypothetical protein